MIGAERVSTRDRRALRWGTILMAGLLVVKLMPSVHAARRAWIESSQLHVDSVVRARNTASQLRSMMDRVRALRTRSAILESRMIVASSKDAADAVLAARLSEIANEVGVSFAEMRPIASPSRFLGYSDVGVLIDGSTDILGLSALWLRLAMDSLDFRVKDLSLEASDPFRADTSSEVVRYRMTILATVTDVRVEGADDADTASRESSDSELVAAADVVASRDLFSFTRRPTSHLEPAALAVRAGAEASDPSPQLKGIAGGPPWSAVLSDPSGRAADVVVRQGDSIWGRRVRSIGATHVVLLDNDSTLTLWLPVRHQ